MDKRKPGGGNLEVSASRIEVQGELLPEAALRLASIAATIRRPMVSATISSTSENPALSACGIFIRDVLEIR